MTTETTAHEILRTAGLTSTNIMTPRVLGVFKLNGDSAAELSAGTGINREPIWGVTIVWHGQRFGHDRSRMFYSEAEARAYIRDQHD